MRGLTVVVPTADRVRCRAALALACAQAALGGRVRLFCQEEAAVLLVERPDPDATALEVRGLPDLPALLLAAREMGVALFVCQTGLIACGLTMDALVDGVEASGAMAMLATLGEDRLIVA